MGSGFKPVIRSYFQTLIVYLSRQYSAQKNQVSGKLFNLASAVAFMENNFLESLEVGSIAAISHLSTRQFSRVFKSYYSMSPKEYLIKLRLDYACKLMEQSNMNLGTIAMDCGFSDISFFSRQFKAKFGISPKKFRRTAKR
jgi:AraC family L-rhamnose operon transcriptional activator RhaR/AraC family L-rhamnose operon regulatory protein RhaS